MAFGLRAGVGTVGWALLRIVWIDRIRTQAYLYYPPPKAVDRWHSDLEPSTAIISFIIPYVAELTLGFLRASEYIKVFHEDEVGCLPSANTFESMPASFDAELDKLSDIAKQGIRGVVMHYMAQAREPTRKRPSPVGRRICLCYWVRMCDRWR